METIECVHNTIVCVYMYLYTCVSVLKHCICCSQVNHLSHFLLTLELLPNILETASTSGDGRIIFVASSNHTWVNWDPANMNAERSYSRKLFYPNSKLYNVRGLISL